MRWITPFTSLPQGRGKHRLEWGSSREVVLWLDNPKARNAMSIAMMHQLATDCEELEEKKTKCCCDSRSE